MVCSIHLPFNSIFQANATFAMVDRINEYAEKWLNVSQQIRQYLEKNTTEHNLKSIREVKHKRCLQAHV